MNVQSMLFSVEVALKIATSFLLQTTGKTDPERLAQMIDGVIFCHPGVPVNEEESPEMRTVVNLIVKIHFVDVSRPCYLCIAPSTLTQCFGSKFLADALRATYPVLHGRIRPYLVSKELEVVSLKTMEIVFVSPYDE